MILGIDAHCIRGLGGTTTHLREVLRVADPALAGFSKVVLWSGRTTLDQIADRPWLQRVYEPVLDRNLLRRSHWSAAKLSERAEAAGCDVLWVPGCAFAGSFRPYVAMSRNMLPFEWTEMRRYGLSSQFMKFFILRFSQIRTFKRSNGMIYLTDYARSKVGSVVGRTTGDARVIPHGIETRFAPAEVEPVAARDSARPIKLLYVSAVDLYKHQWKVVEAVEWLQRQGLVVELDLIGPSFPAGGKRLQAALRNFAGAPGSVRYLGRVKHAELHQYYQQADIFVYASSCENLPNILLEAMASGRPIASSSRGPMPEVLRDGGVYFDPEDALEIASAVRQLVESPALGREKAARALEYSREYTWERCAAASFSYLAEVAVRHRSTSNAR